MKSEGLFIQSSHAPDLSLAIRKPLRPRSREGALPMGNLFPARSGTECFLALAIS